MDPCYQALNCPAKPTVCVSCCFLALIPGFPGILFKSALANTLSKARQGCSEAVGHSLSWLCFSLLFPCRVRYILNVTREIDNFFPGLFEYHNIRVYDEEATDLLAYWNDTYKFISKAK